jgi:nematocidal protein AidA
MSPPNGRSGGPAVQSHEGVSIYIQTVFDTKTILKNYPKSTNYASPTWLPHPPPAGQTLMYMLTNWGDQISGQATGNLELRAERNDIINWRTTTLSSNTGDAAVINAIQVTTSGVIGTPQMMLTRPDVPVPVLPPTPPYPYKWEAISDSYWYSIVADVGSTTYSVFFYILHQDADTRKMMQYFYAWDPTITVVKGG